MVGPILIIKLDDASVDDAIAPFGGRCVVRCIMQSGASAHRCYGVGQAAGQSGA